MAMWHKKDTLKLKYKKKQSETLLNVHTNSKTILIDYFTLLLLKGFLNFSFSFFSSSGLRTSMLTMPETKKSTYKYIYV